MDDIIEKWDGFELGTDVYRFRKEFDCAAAAAEIRKEMPWIRVRQFSNDMVVTNDRHNQQTYDSARSA